MFAICRAIAVWVLAIAMPLHGLAGSGMLLCGALHGGVGGEHSVNAHAPAGDPTLNITGDSAHLHAGADLAAEPVAQHDHPGCSVCAACCAATALPAAAFIPPVLVSPAQAFHAWPDAPAVSQPPDGLERPPRTDLA